MKDFVVSDRSEHSQFVQRGAVDQQDTTCDVADRNACEGPKDSRREINRPVDQSEDPDENDRTGVVPMSHRSRRPSPPPDMEADSPLIKPVEGRAGSVMLWHGGLLHQARANQSEDVRIGLNIAYYPPWFNNWIEGGHQPLWPETYERMPDDFRRLCPGLLGRRRADRYERR